MLFILQFQTPMSGGEKQINFFLKRVLKNGGVLSIRNVQIIALCKYFLEFESMLAEEARALVDNPAPPKAKGINSIPVVMTKKKSESR